MVFGIYRHNSLRVQCFPQQAQQRHDCTLHEMDAHNVALQLRTLEGNMWLHVSWHPKGARCHVGGDVPREKEQKAYTFSQTLRSQIWGLNIVSVGLARPMERVVRLDLAPRLDTPSTFRLYVEIMASRSNVVLVAVDEASGSETIAACAYQVSPSKSVRPLSTGQAYELPPAMTARRRPRPEEPFEDFVEAVGRVPTQQLKKALVAVYQGLSPMLVTVMASRVPGLTAATKVGEVSPEQWSALFDGPWKRWLRVIGDGGDAAAGAAAVADGAGAGGDAASNVPTKPWISEDGASYYPTTLGEGEGDDDGAADVAAAGQGGRSKVFSLARLEKIMEKYYRGTQSNEEFDGLKRRCLSRVTATLAKLRERAAEFEDQQAAAQEDKVSELNRRGDLLMTYGYDWEYGQTHVHCEDFDTGEPVSIEIPRDKTPIDVAQEAFKLGKKLKRSAAVVKELLDRANAQILYAEGIEMALEQLRGGNPGTASSREELSVLRGVAEELGILGGADAARSFASAFGVKQVQSGGTTNDGSGKRGGNRKGNRKGAAGGKKGKGGGGGRGGGGKKEAPTAGLLELRREPGAPAVLVGRNNQQNERITFSLARGHELWLHARGVAGAHVLLRLDPGQEVEDDDLAFAADVAAFFSKARQSASTPVDYISPKMVKKLGGGGPGMVKFDGAKVVRGEPGRRIFALVRAR
ncbi:conserved unknown protein [Ectocarpus siliculosus]|uniref:NFACT RNA-binding domain-containing protein n=1 Tax=Ectocarpus siliculosus TaxID=2880 RepID=D8LSX7_ECTSI|nr:conserved unknown protein [Ectocarpus siliculosus]|eukprot:CBN77904.1 conserved unknown protein [Ectocarpus siliculosus]